MVYQTEHSVHFIEQMPPATFYFDLGSPFAYLAAERLDAVLPAGARVVSYVWDMGGWKPADVRQLSEHSIFLWRIPG